ncbi:MAG: hypothetical protein K2M14_06295 [Muribaculaceae bacterium]|nr:hypothetical protein [Muribaculaceae bacterium]
MFVDDGRAFFAISTSNSSQKSSAIQKISVTLLSVIMIQYLLFGTSKLLNISDITKRIGNFFKLPIHLFYDVPYPELALISMLRLLGLCRYNTSLSLDGVFQASEKGLKIAAGGGTRINHT